MARSRRSRAPGGPAGLTARSLSRGRPRSVFATGPAYYRLAANPDFTEQDGAKRRATMVGHGVARGSGERAQRAAPTAGVTADDRYFTHLGEMWHPS